MTDMERMMTFERIYRQDMRSRERCGDNKGKKMDRMRKKSREKLTHTVSFLDHKYKPQTH